MNLEMFKKVFPLGSHLCREPMPVMSELKKDMENLKKHGFNLVKIQENWSVDQPLEEHLDLSKYEELIQYAGKLDMGVYLGFTCEQAPMWLWEKYPDASMVGVNGFPIHYKAQTTAPADGKPGPCYDHPGAMEEQLKFITKVVSELGKYENIVVWNTWQEIAYLAEVFTGQSVCYCENTKNHFRRWLKEKYIDLDGLNRAWNSRYMDWKYVVPDQQVIGKTCISSDKDWKYFMNNVQMAEVLKKRAEAIKITDPFKRPVFAHKSSPTVGSGVDWTYARCQDYVGTSIYPAWHRPFSWDDAYPKDGIFDRKSALLNEMWGNLIINIDYLRSCNRRDAQIWVAEFQGGPVNTDFHKGRVPSAEDMRRWMLSAIGSGTTGISFWVTRAEIMASETNGFSLLDSQGDTTERFEEISRIGKALNCHAELFAKPTWMGSEIGIIVNEWNYQLCKSLNQGGDNLTYSLRGWHRILWDAGITMDFVDTTQLDDKDINKYKVLILPFPLSISEEIAMKLKAYVEKGGNLISEAAAGRLSDNAYANRGELSPILAELFSIRSKNFKMVREPGNERRWSPQERTWGEYDDPAMLVGTGEYKNMSLRANVYIQVFDEIDSEAILKYKDDTAGTVRKLNKGRAYILGTFVGHNGTAYCDKETRKLIKKILEDCGVKGELDSELILRKRISNNKEAWIFINPTEKDIEETLNVDSFKKVEDLLKDDLKCDSSTATFRVKAFDVRVLIMEK